MYIIFIEKKNSWELACHLFERLVNNSHVVQWIWYTTIVICHSVLHFWASRGFLPSVLNPFLTQMNKMLFSCDCCFYLPSASSPKRGAVLQPLPLMFIIHPPMEMNRVIIILYETRSFYQKFMCQELSSCNLNLKLLFW